MSEAVRVLLPLSDATVKEIVQQVTARGQGDRVGTYRGRVLVDLAGVAIVASPEDLIEVREN